MDTKKRLNSFEKSCDYNVSSISKWVEDGNSYMNGHKNTTTISSAVLVTNAYKSYKSGEPVLKNFSMNVPTGTIYSLIGSSGCGKTTLLSCCVGLSKLDSGNIKIFGAEPGSRRNIVPGYMPQDLSLYMEFTIEESFYFFGRLYGMSKEKIRSEITFLLDLLDLPDSSRRINTLSGGQKRRVSFGLAVFHKAPLLILDEPTVGVDPILRESIWNYLSKLVSIHKTTVILVTHVISEATQSNMIGVMRNGRLLVEKSPDALLTEFGFPLLEQVVLHLCKKDNGQDPKTNVDISPYNNMLKIKNGLNKDDVLCLEYQKIDPFSNKNDHLRDHQQSVQTTAYHAQNVSKEFCRMLDRLQALITKNFIILYRNLLFLLFVFLVPSMQIMLICLAIGPDPKHLNLGVVNYEVTDSSKICEPTTGCDWDFLGCRYLAMLPKTSFNLIPYATEEIALRDIKKGHLWAYLTIPQNYSSYMMDRVLSGAYATNETYDGSRITFEMDMSNKQIGQTMKKTFFDIFQKFITKFTTECETNSRQTELPLYFKPPVYGTDDTSFSEFLAPSVLLGLLYFFPLTSSGIAYITEKKMGTLDRSIVAGVTNAEIMVAHLLSQGAILLGQSSLAFLSLTLVFQIPINGSIALAITLAILIGIGGMSMGFLISTICNEEIESALLAIGSFFPNFILAGVVWPRESMPYVLQYISYLLPCTLACESMRSIVSRGWGLTHPSVWPGFVSTIAWICIYWTLTILLHRLSYKK